MSLQLNFAVKSLQFTNYSLFLALLFVRMLLAKSEMRRNRRGKMYKQASITSKRLPNDLISDFLLTDDQTYKSFK